MNVLKFRPHHFLCSLCFVGKGYSPAFIKNLKTITDALKADERQQIKIIITLETDSICQPCPHLHHNKCACEQKVKQMDEQFCQALDLQEGNVFKWKTKQEHVKNNLTMEKFHRICAPCSWKKIGVCEKILKKLCIQQ